MRDPRLEQYAQILVETSIDVQPGWQVLISAGPLGRPLVDELAGQIGARGAYALIRDSLTGSIPWMLAAPEELLDALPSIEAHALETADALIAISAPENTRETSALSPERLGRLHAASRPHLERVYTNDLKWVGCNYPTPALAQDAGMSLRDYEDFLYGACLLDWDAERGRMSRYAERFDAADEVRILGAETDLTLSLAGRSGKVDDGAGGNLPGGEFYYSPVEDSAEGTISFTEFPAPYGGREVTGIRLRFEGGRVVDATAQSEEEFLLEMLDQDEGARRLGELGIGCNPGITRFMKNTLFDEKIDGTIHLALGNGLPWVGGTNQSEIHWDIVKDLRPGGQILLDGEVVQQDGLWRI
jgi:aminopeptidase